MGRGMVSGRERGRGRGKGRVGNFGFHDPQREIERLEFTNRRRGKQIGALYWVIRTLGQGHSQIYRIANNQSFGTQGENKQIEDFLVKQLQTGQVVENELAPAPSQDGKTDRWTKREYIEHYDLAIGITLNCNLCFENCNWGIRRPIVFSCGHTVCLTCTHAHFQDAESPSCPQCRRPITYLNVLRDELSAACPSTSAVIPMEVDHNDQDAEDADEDQPLSRLPFSASTSVEKSPEEKVWSMVSFPKP